jgi:arylformamidase
MSLIYHDITLKFEKGMVLYTGDPELSINEHSSISGGDLYNLSTLCFGSHTGTHIDAPKHFYDDGLTVDQLGLDYFVGRARVIEIKDPVSVKVVELKQHYIMEGDRLLIKTRNSGLLKSGVFEKEYCWLEPDAAAYLADIGIRTLGFDYLSVERYGSEVPEVHYRLLGHNIVIVEGLQLEKIVPGLYEMYILPLNIKGGNGSPARAILAEDVD